MMKNLSDSLTVFLLTGQNNINLPDTLKSIQNQSVAFKFETIDGFTPLAAALQEMVNRCQTRYYIQVDEDMVLNQNAIEIMYNTMVKSNEFFCRVFPLLDPHLGKIIWGIKIFDHSILSKYAYNLNSPSASVELFKKIQADGYKFNNEQNSLGSHSPQWTPETVYNRYFVLTKKIKSELNGEGYGNLQKIFTDKLLDEYNVIDFWALMGVLTAKYSNKYIKFSELQSLFNKQTNKLRIGKVIDQFGWAFYFIAKEMARYSQHTITYEKYDNVKYDNLDIVLISNPNICSNVSDAVIPKTAKESGLKVIGQYCGEVDAIYKYADLIITISPQTYNFAKGKYSIPVIYLPESIDTNFFTPKEFNPTTFKVGWAGRENPIKRPYLLDKLAYPVKKKADWGKPFFNEESTSQPMFDFYHSIDCLVLTSASECQPRVIMEAMACGLPVVSTDVGSVHMLLDKEWIVPVTPDKSVIEEMNKRLTNLAENPELRESVGKRNRAYIVKKFSWEVNQKYWDEVFLSLHNNDMDNIQRIHNNFLKWNRKAFLRKAAYSYDRNTNKFFNYTTTPIVNPIVGSTYNNTLQKIKDLNIKFWYLKYACLYIVNGIQKEPPYLTIGVRTEEEKNKILEIFPNGKGIEIIVDSRQKIKPWNADTYVPMPVVAYLQNMFGKDWSQLKS